MQRTSLLDILFHAREEKLVALLRVLPLLLSVVSFSFVAKILTGLPFGWAVLISLGVVLSLMSLLIGFFLLGAVAARLELERGVTLSAVIRSSGFALLRSQPKSPAQEPLAFVIGAGASASRGGPTTEDVAGALRKRRRDRVKAALRSSGFSVIRENLPDKDRTEIG